MGSSGLSLHCSEELPLPRQDQSVRWTTNRVALCMPFPQGPGSVGRPSDGPNRVPVALGSPADTDGEVRLERRVTHA